MRWLLLLTAGCITAPEIVMVDRATALEEQAAGSYDELQQRLYRAGMTPAPVPLTPDQLEALGVKPAPLVDTLSQSPADHVDELLRRHCAGEGLEGLLVETRPKECHRGLSPADDALIARVNEARQRLWRWMSEQKAAAAEVEVRRAWRKKHLEGVVCGGWVQSENGAWDAKKC
jgi:hypothetical protein